ncbi:sushi, von Willebrand factor type A, EGF and pentraxin domain-containing protein 1-like [Mercenaria mercenaria]|uniref:sushi, von Willebrand factor type A, EGF and pentraxin domain-containing protein 1-like n=1 Tax=Mercenaria mercenaria TaxID=6596 RepID=UPI00234F3F9F|nr:sushi, von Willebrand factor type A, EGF and pentraxin domain-containing protein 1-like [Mercenaria mercenaria]
MMYDLSPCSLTHSFDHYVGITVEDCILACRRRKICAAVNYNRYNKLCALRKSSEIELLGSEPEWCYDIVISNETAVLDGPCKDNPCNETSICLNSTKFPFFKCRLEYCLPEQEVANAAFRNKVLSLVGDRNELVCDKGFTPFGKQSLTCLKGGNWSTTDLQCLKTCTSIPLKSTAVVSSWSTYRFVVNTTASFTCKEGFYNLTDTVIVCDKFGTWSEFECVPFCRQADIVPIKNGSPKPGDNYTIYTQGEYVCNVDFYLSSGSKFVSCDVKGTWSEPEVTCFQFCKQINIPTVSNGHPLHGTLYNHTTTARYECDPGFYLSDGSPEVACNTDGTWSTPKIECYPFCQQPVIANGFLQNPASEPIKKDVSVVYSCNYGYNAYPHVTNPTAVCQKTGSWTYSAACNKNCGDAPNYTWEKIIGYSSGPPYTTGTLVYYKCVEVGLHFSAGGGDKKTCNSNGEWSESCGVSPLKCEGIAHTDPAKKANILNKQFESVFLRPQPISLKQICRSLVNPPSASMPPVSITVEGIDKLLSGLSPNKASSPD